jgi:hypothetical protein
MRSRKVLLLTLCAAAAAVPAGGALASTSHKGWPHNDMQLMNKTDRSRPLDARPGHDPFDGADRTYSCDAVHSSGSCQQFFVAGPDGGRVMTDRKIHSELLGGHGSDTIHAGPLGDVLWGDYKPSGQPSSQHDRLYGGDGKDFIYASHGYNLIEAGGGDDFIKAHYGHGIIDCGGGHDTLYISHKAQRHYKIRNCERISHKALGY